MEHEFTIDFERQTEWSWLIVTAFFLGGVGGGLYLISPLVGFSPGAWISLIVVAFGAGTALLLDLGHPERVWRMISQVGSSWISRGTLTITLFLVFGSLSAIGSNLQASWLPWASGTLLGELVRYLAILFAFGVTIYGGFVMSRSPSIAFWNSPVLPILFVTYALMGGVSVIFAASPFAGGSVNLVDLESIEIALILVALLLMGTYVTTMHHSTIAAARSVTMLLRGRLAFHFLFGVLGMGLAIPLLVSLYAVAFISEPAAVSAILAMTGLLELAGGYLFRYSLLNVGIYAPLL